MRTLGDRYGTKRWSPVAFVLTCALAPGWGIAEEPEPAPDWAKNLGLFIFGGPASAGVNVRLNGRNVANVADGSGSSTHGILDALESGVNELVVEFLANDTPAAGRDRLTVSLATSRLKEDGKRTLDESIAETSLPAIPAASACTETFRFWAGPPPETTEELQKRYFVRVHGPPVGYLVTILINGSPVYTTTRGERFFEVTSFIVKGKNWVEFEAVPGCFGDGITAEGRFSILLAAGRMGEDEFEWEGQALGEFDLVRQKNPRSFTRRQNFRAR